MPLARNAPPLALRSVSIEMTKRVPGSRFRALSPRASLRLWREAFAPEYIQGRLVGQSARLLGVSVVHDASQLIGFSILRKADVTDVVSPPPHETFERAALRALGLRVPQLERQIDLTSWRTIAETAAGFYPLVTLHTEVRDPEVCYVGRFVETSARRGELVTISPDAAWDSDPAEHMHVRWSDVTRMDLATSYAEALWRVGGPPPIPTIGDAKLRRRAARR